MRCQICGFTIPEASYANSHRWKTIHLHHVLSQIHDCQQHEETCKDSPQGEALWVSALRQQVFHPGPSWSPHPAPPRNQAPQLWQVWAVLHWAERPEKTHAGAHEGEAFWVSNVQGYIHHQQEPAATHQTISSRVRSGCFEQSTPSETVCHEACSGSKRK